MLGAEVGSERSTGEWVVGRNRIPCAARVGKEFCFHDAGEGVVETLVDRGRYRAFPCGDGQDVLDVGDAEVAETEFVEQALVVEVLDAAQC